MIAVIAIAIVPQKQILIIPLVIFDPPDFAAPAPNKARNTIEKEYW